jgi:exosortase D (VPLPA-CTERM-specific)
LIGVLYYSTFCWLLFHDWSRGDYDYSYLIPFIVLYLIYEKKNAFFSSKNSPSWLGILPVLIGLCLFWLGELSGEIFSIYISFWLLLIGICWMNVGWSKLKIILFPLSFMITMFPVPYFLHNKLTSNLQLISSKYGVLFIQLYGMSAYREGNVIDLGFTQLQVVEACSGLRYVIPLFILGILMAYILRSVWWKRVVLIASTIPLSIFVNSFRIAMTGILYKHWGPQVAQDFFHGFSGWLIFIFCLPVLLFEIWILRKLPPRTSQKKKAGEEEKNCAIPDVNPNKASGLRALWTPHFILSVLLLGTTLVLSRGVEFREKIPIARPLNLFPSAVGEWVGARQVMEKKFLDELDLTDYVIDDFSNPSGKLVNFYVAYYESQRKGESIHSPETCLPGGGWVFEESGQATVPVPGYENTGFKVNRAYINKGPYRQLAYFWFPMRGRILTNAWQLKAYTFWDALTKHRTDGALVRLITPVGENEKLEDADRRLTKFTQEIVPILDQFLPGRDAAGSPSVTGGVPKIRQAVQK